MGLLTASGSLARLERMTIHNNNFCYDFDGCALIIITMIMLLGLLTASGSLARLELRMMIIMSKSCSMSLSRHLLSKFKFYAS